MHCSALACILARASAGRSMAARMAMMAMTTNNSMRVNPLDSPPAFISVLALTLLGQDEELLADAGVDIGGQIEIAASVKHVGQNGRPLAEGQGGVGAREHNKRPIGRAVGSLHGEGRAGNAEARNDRDGR